MENKTLIYANRSLMYENNTNVPLYKSNLKNYLR